MEVVFEFWTRQMEYAGRIQCNVNSWQFARLEASGYTWYRAELPPQRRTNHLYTVADFHRVKREVEAEMWRMVDGDSVR